MHSKPPRVQNCPAQHRPGTVGHGPVQLGAGQGQNSHLWEHPQGSRSRSSVTPAHDLPAEETDQTLELTPKVPLRPANWTNRTSKLTPPQKKKKRRGREVGLACLHTGGAPRRAGESQNLPSATPLPSWRALGSCFPVRKIRFGSTGWLKNLHASDLKGKGAQEKLSTNVKITQPGVCLPRPCWSSDVYELRAGRSRLEVSRGTLRSPVHMCPQRRGRRAAAVEGKE